MPKMNIALLIAGIVQTNVYLVMNEETKELIVIDPAAEAKMIEKKIEDMGGTPVAILLTHGHFDHILAANALKESYGIPIVACSAEKEILENPDRNSVFGMRAPAVHVDEEVNDSDKLDYAGFEIEVMHTPGHTKGSVCYYFPNEKVLFSGDTLFRLSCGRTDLPGGDQDEIIVSVRRLLADLPPDTTVFPGHEGYTDIATEQRYNPIA